MTALTLYFAPYTCSFVTMAALEETGHPFDVRLVDLGAGNNRRLDFLAINPAGKVPVLVVDDNPITENAAILMWLAERFPEQRLLPEPRNGRDRVEALADLVYLASTIQPLEANIRRPEWISATDPERARQRAIGHLQVQLDWIEARLAKGGWWYGDRWSLVDTHLAWLWTAASHPPGVDAASYPNLGLLASNVLRRPASQRALEGERSALAELGRRAAMTKETAARNAPASAVAASF